MKRVHLVFSQRLTSLEAQLEKTYVIEGWSPSLEKAIAWAKGQSDSTEILLINGLDHYRSKKRRKQDLDQLLIEQLAQLQQWRPELRIILFLPEVKNKDQKLLVDLMKLHIYDFWFEDAITVDDLLEIMKEKRDLDELEAYLKTLPLPDKLEERVGSYPISQGLEMIEEMKARISMLFSQEKNRADRTNGVFGSLKKLINVGKDKKLNYLSGGCAYFWSETNVVETYAVAVFQALLLAMEGHKTILVELPQPRPYLAESLGLRHPRWNIKHALALFDENPRLSYESSLFNGEHLYCCDSAYDHHKYLKDYPKELFFLPGLMESPLKYQECPPETWEAFVNGWTRWAVFCQKFKFIIFVGVGIHPLHQRMIEQLTYFRVNVMEAWPSGYNLASAMETEKPGENLFLWSRKRRALTKEQRRMAGGIHYLLPDTLAEDYLALSSFEVKPGKMSVETRAFIDQINRIFLGQSREKKAGEILLADE